MLAPQLGALGALAACRRPGAFARAARARGRAQRAQRPGGARERRRSPRAAPAPLEGRVGGAQPGCCAGRPARQRPPLALLRSQPPSQAPRSALPSAPRAFLARRRGEGPPRPPPPQPASQGGRAEGQGAGALLSASRSVTCVTPLLPSQKSRASKPPPLLTWAKRCAVAARVSDRDVSLHEMSQLSVKHLKRQGTMFFKL